MEILNSCNDLMLQNILSIVKRIVLLIQIIAPILLIIWGSIGFIDLMRNPDEDKKNLKKVINKFLAAAVIFLIPFMIDAVMYMVGDNTRFSSCYRDANGFIDINREYSDTNTKEKSTIIPDTNAYEKGVKKQNNADTNRSGEATTNKGSKIIPSSYQEKGAQAFAAAAREELAAWNSGEADYKRYKTPFTGPTEDAGGWCGMFIGYIGGKVGSGCIHWEGDALPAEPTTPRNYHDWYMKNPQAGEITDNASGVKPKVGDLVLMWNGAHVEMVENVKSDGFWCISGGGSVDHNWHSFENENDTWFITPNWKQVTDTSNWDNLIRKWGSPIE